MKKLKSSVKAIIISAVVLVAALGIVLGVVFGMKGNGGKPPISKGPYYNLSKDILSGQRNSETYVSDTKVYKDFCDNTNLKSFGKTYFSYIDKTTGDEIVYHYVKTTDGQYKYTNLTAKTNDQVPGYVNEDALGYKILKLTNKYLVIENAFKYQSSMATSAEYVVIYIADDVPSKVFSLSDSDSQFFFFNEFYITDTMFAYALVSDSLDIYFYKLSNSTEVSSENIYAVENFEWTAENTFSIELFENGFTFLTNYSLKIGYLEDGEIRVIEKIATSTEKIIEQTFNIQKISANSFLLEDKKQVNAQNANEKTVIEGSELYNYDYSIVKFEEGVVEKQLNLSNGYAKLSISKIADYSKHIYVCEQKIVENVLVNSYLSKYYDDKFDVVLEYESRLNEVVVYTNTKTFVTQERIFKIDENSLVNIVKFADLGDFEIAQDNIVCDSFAYRLDSYYGIMKVDGSFIYDATHEDNEVLFKKIYPVSGDYVIGYSFDAEPKYFAINTKSVQDPSYLKTYYVDQNIEKLLNFGVNINLILDTDEDTFYLYENSLKIADGITSYKFTETMEQGAFIEFYAETDLVKLIQIDKPVKFNFVNDGALAYSIQKFAKKVQPYFNSQTIYIKDTSTKIGKLEVYEHNLTGTTLVAGNWYDDALKITMEYGYYILHLNFTVDFVNNKSYTVKSTMSSPSDLSDNGSENNNSHPFKMYINDSGCVVYDWTTKNGYYPFADIEFPDGDEYLTEGASTDGFDRFVFTLSFDTNGGSSVSSKTIKYGKSYTKASDYTSTPTKTGYTFSKWTTSNTSTTAVNSFTCSGDKKLYAQYTANVYKIKYVYNSGSAGTYAPATMTYDSWDTISNPTRTGYKFKSWKIEGMNSSGVDHYYGTSTSSYDTTTSASISSTKVTKYKNLQSATDAEVTFTASWTPITYYVNYSYSSDLTADKTDTETYDSWFTPTIPIRTGYTFASWEITDMSSGYTHYYGTSSSSYQTTTGTSLTANTSTYFKNLDYKQDFNVYFAANWTANSYTISYAMGDSSGTTTAAKGSTSPTTAVYDQWFQVSNPTRTGYQFAGWTITSMGTTDTSYTNAVTHLYGTSTASYLTTTDASVSGVKGTYFKNLESFAGYSVTFTAVWTPNVYNLNYTLGGGTNATGTPTTAKFDEWFYIAYPTRVGYTFASWNLSDMNYTTGVYHYFGNSTTDYTTNQSTALNGVTATYFMNLDYGNSWTAYFTAVWTANKYYIEYVAGGGELGDKKPSEATFDQWFSISVPASAPQGYYFNGWVISNMTTDCDHYYGSSTTVYTTNKLATHTAETTDLYFKNLHSGSLSTTYTITITINWSPYEYAVSYDLKGGTHGSTHPSSAYYDTPFSVSNPTRSGYTFDGWSFNGLNDICTHYYYNSSNVSTSFTSTNGRYPDAINPNYDTIVYVSKFMNLDINGSAVLLVANWIANTYTITYYYIPTTFDTSSVTIDTLNNAGYMTASKTQTVTFDMNFTTYKPSNSGVNSNEFALPNGVRAEYWVISTSQLSSSTSVVSWSDDTSSSITGAAYAFDTDYIYDTYAQDIYCYVAYIYSDITVKYYTASSADTRNNLAGYSYYLTDAAKYNMLYTTKSLSGIAGWLISANHFISGSMSPGSYSVFTFKGTTYSATNGGQIWWIYSNTNAYNFDDPVYYAYAVYTVNGTYSLEPPVEEEVDVAEEKETFAMNEVSIDNVKTYDTPEEKVDEKIILTNSSISSYVSKEEYVDPKNIKK